MQPPGPGPTFTAALVALIALTGLAGCGSGHGDSTTTTTTTAATATTVAPSSTSTTPSTTAPVTTTTGAVPGTSAKGAAVTISGFTSSPASPVPCNAPTMIELTWVSKGVNSVSLDIDGTPSATYGGGAQDHLQYFACDGKEHTYTLRAESGGEKATVSLGIASKSP